MLPTKNYVDRPKTKSVNEDNSQNMYFFYKKKTTKNMILQEKNNRLIWISNSL
jgi:hypothetical protein